MKTYYLNGTVLEKDADFTLNGMTYPYSWLEGTSPAVRASLGIEATGDINYDMKYYWGIDNPKSLEDTEDVDKDGNPMYVTVWDPEAVVEGSPQLGATVNTEERSVTKGLKTICSAEVKYTTNNLLKPTDYYILRNAVEESEIPASVSTYRTAVITESDRVVTAIAGVDSVEDLIEIMSSIAWPEAE